MRRVLTVLTTIIFITALSSSFACADGLYKGHGRRSYAPLDNPWEVRLNASGGIHGAYQSRNGYDDYGSLGYYDDPWDEWDMGGYLSAGLELNTGNGVSLEPYALYRLMDQDERWNYVQTIRSDLRPMRLEAYGGGLTVRKYRNWHGGAAYFGLGGGYVHGEGEWFIPGDGRLLFEDDAPEIHFLVGGDFHLSPTLAMGLELGWRHTWLDRFTEFDGLVVGLRLGLLLPR